MRVIIRPEIYAQIDYYVQNTDIEISGLGRVKKHKNGTLEVTKVYLLDQENTGASTDIDAESVAQLMYTSREDAELGDLNFWWHSHVNMGVFWSGTDMDTIYQFGENGYLLATVFNKARQYRSAIYSGGTDFLPAIFRDEIPTDITYQMSEETQKALDAEIKLKAKPKKFTPKYKYPYENEDHWDYGNGVNTYNTMNKANKKKRKGNKKKATTLLTEETHALDNYDITLECEAAEMVDAYMNEEQEAEWSVYCAEYCNIDPTVLTYLDLWTFYESFDGDFSAMSITVLNEMSEREMAPTSNGNLL